MFRLPKLVTVKLPQAEGEYTHTTFQELFPHIGRELAKKYKKLLQVQEDMIRAIRKGDMVVVSGPNTGKSQTMLAYCCEEVVRVQKSERESFHAFFLTPTNALALSLKEKVRGLNEMVANGALRLDFYQSGTDYEKRRETIREQADHHLLFFTPEMLAATLASALSRGKEPWYNYLLGTDLIVIDEFDALGPLRQAMAIALVRILKVYAAKQDRELRVALMSATIANPEELLEDILFGGTVVRGAARHGELTITLHPFAKPGGRRWELKKSHFENLLDWILAGGFARGKILIYMDNKAWIDAVVRAKRLRERNFGVIYRGIPQGHVEEVLEEFMWGDLRGLVVTMSVEAGQDFPDLKYLIIVGFPAGGLRGLVQLPARVARDVTTSGRVHLFLTSWNRVDKYYLDYPEELQEVLQTGRTEPLRVPLGNERVVRFMLLLAGLLRFERKELVQVLAVSGVDLVRYEQKVMGCLTEFLTHGYAMVNPIKHLNFKLEQVHYLFFRDQFHYRPREVVLRDEQGNEIGWVEFTHAVAHVFGVGMTFLFKGQVFETSRFTEEDAVVRVASEPIHCTNRYSRIPKIGRSIVWRAQGVEAEFGRIQVQYKSFKRQRVHLDSGERLSEIDLEDVRGFSLDTEGFLIQLTEGLTEYETELLGAALVRAAATELGVDSGALTCWYEWEGRRLVVVDEGGPTGFAKQVWEALPILLPIVKDRLATCPCERRGCPHCVNLRSLKSAPLVVTWENVVNKLKEVQ